MSSTHDRRDVLRLVLLTRSSGMVGAEEGHVTPFTGTWKLDPARSRFHPGPPFRSFTLTFTPDGVRHLDLVAAGGQRLEASLPWSDGKEVPVTVIEGVGNFTATSKIRGRSFHDAWKDNGNVFEKVHAAVSADGKTLAIKVGGQDKSGRPFHNRLTFARQ
jgi:hypothetical protein